MLLAVQAKEAPQQAYCAAPFETQCLKACRKQKVLTCQEIEKVMFGDERGPITRWNVHIDQDAQNFHKEVAVYVWRLQTYSALSPDLALD